jgi:hypothetical protein
VKLPLDVRQGSTFSFVLRWETTPIVYKPITAIVAQAPARLTVAGHGLTNGWRAAVVSVRGMTQINAEDAPPRDAQYHPVTVVDPNTVELNAVNAAGFSPYVGGGYLQFNTPADLTGFTARMQVKDKVGGTELMLLSTGNGRIVLDNVAKTITLTIPATDTAALAFTSAVYDLEMVSPTGVVTPIAEGALRVSKEVTTTT